MDYVELKEVFFSQIKNDDPYKASKQVQVRNWCRAFSVLFDGISGKKHLPFLLDVLFDEKCWEEKNNTIHGVKLNRRSAARKMLAPESWRGISNTFDEFERFQIANWCCLEEDILSLFEYFKKEKRVKINAKPPLKCVIITVNVISYPTQLMEYWSHVLTGRTSELELEGKNLYEYGLDHASSLPIVFLEAIEYFWNKIKSSCDDDMKIRRKNEVFLRTTLRAAGTYSARHPEIFEFCFSQLNVSKYPELLKRDFDENEHYGSLNALQCALRFDLFKKLFDASEPCNISGSQYHNWLKRVGKGCLEHYAKVCETLFMHMWTKEGFDSHRSIVLKKEITENHCFLATGLFMPLIDGNCMELVWAVLDKASPSQIKVFMKSKQAEYIYSVLKGREDHDSLGKFLSYGSFKVRDNDSSD